MNNLRSQFPILKTQLNGHDLVYLDSAATSQKPQEVIDAINNFYTNHNASSHSVHSLGSQVTEMVEQTRQVVADFIGSGVDEAVFTSGATEGINLIANGFLEVSLRCHSKLDLESKMAENIIDYSNDLVKLKFETEDSLSVEKNTPSVCDCHPSRGELDRHGFNSLNRFCLTPDSEILICVDQHHSNILPWQRLAELVGCKIVFFGVLDSGRWDLSDFESKLNMHTKVIAISNVSNVLGVAQDVGEINKILDQKYFSNGRHIEQSEISHASMLENQELSKTKSTTTPSASLPPLQRGELHSHSFSINSMSRPIVVLDATQAVSHYAVDVKELDVDFLVFSGHKVYGPTGVGVLYGRSELLQVLPSYKVGGDMVESVTLCKNVYKESPFRFEAGTANFGSIIGLKAALNWFIRSRDEIFEVEDRLFGYLVEKLSEIEGLKILGEVETLDYPVASQQPLDRGNLGLNLSTSGGHLDFVANREAKAYPYKSHKVIFSHIPLVSFIIDGVNSLDLALMLDQSGICVRSGQHCAGILHEYLGVDSSCRISLACFNTKQEIDLVVYEIKKAIKILK
jgi:cysteine desulfurase / selenocysteine lyase